MIAAARLISLWTGLACRLTSYKNMIYWTKFYRDIFIIFIYYRNEEFMNFNGRK